MGRRDTGDGPSEQVGLGSLEVLAIFYRGRSANSLYRPTPPGPVKRIDVQTGKEVISMPKNVKAEPEELEDDDVEETEDSDDDAPVAKGNKGNKGNLVPREPISVPKDVVAGLSEEVRKLLKQREKLLAAGDQKGLRKVRMQLRKAGFRLSDHAGKGDKIANAAKATAKPAKARPAASDDDE